MAISSGDSGCAPNLGCVSSGTSPISTAACPRHGALVPGHLTGPRRPQIGLVAWRVRSRLKLRASAISNSDSIGARNCGDEVENSYKLPDGGSMPKVQLPTLTMQQLRRRG